MTPAPRPARVVLAADLNEALRILRVAYKRAAGDPTLFFYKTELAELGKACAKLHDDVARTDDPGTDPE